MAIAHRTRRHISPRRPQGQRSPVAEIIGRGVLGSAQLSVYKSRGAVTSIDETVPDYSFYDKLRRGKQPGYKLGALFAKRIEHIFAGWTLGRGVDVELVEMGEDDNPANPINYTNGKLGDFFHANHSMLMNISEDRYGLGDQYIIVNADGTLSVPSPDTVEVERDPLDYRTVLAVRVTTKLPTATVVDEYRANKRTLSITLKGEGIDATPKVKRFENLIGRIPVVSLHHGMSGNETNGHSIHEDLLKLYDQYDNVIHKQIDGAVLLGNPILAISGLEDLSAVIDANKPATPADYYDQDGALVTRPELNIDTNSILLIGKGGSAGFVAPPVGFTADTQQALKTLFLLLLDRTGIPEFIWGNEMSSARASSDTQMIQWAHDVEALQKADERWLLELFEIWLATAALTDPKLVQDALKVEWPPVLDENQELKLKAIEMARTNNLLTDKTTLELLQLVEDADDEVEEAATEAKARADDEQKRTIDTAKAMPKPTVGGAVRQMNGYTEREATAIVAGAVRQLAGGE